MPRDTLKCVEHKVARDFAQWISSSGEPVGRINRDLMHLWDTDLPDVEIRMQGQVEARAHKQAFKEWSSPDFYVKSILYGPQKDGVIQVDLKDIESSLISHFLGYLYTGDLHKQCFPCANIYKNREVELYLDLAILANRFRDDDFMYEAQRRFFETLLGDSTSTKYWSAEETSFWPKSKLDNDSEEIIDNLIRLGKLVLKMENIPEKGVFFSAVMICIATLQDQIGNVPKLKAFIEKEEGVSILWMNSENIFCGSCKGSAYAVGHKCRQHREWPCRKAACMGEVLKETACFRCFAVGVFEYKSGNFHHSF